jgi:hypothetical protein
VNALPVGSDKRLQLHTMAPTLSGVIMGLVQVRSIYENR